MATRKGVSAAKSAPEVPTSGPLCRIFGVRHLSPMGAHHLAKFLDDVDPTAVLVEGPSDATENIVHLADKRTKPSIALLAFTKERPVRSILFPLAEYSPEWVALTWALKKKRVARFIDLPAETFLGRSAPRPEESMKSVLDRSTTMWVRPPSTVSPISVRRPPVDTIVNRPWGRMTAVVESTCSVSKFMLRLPPSLLRTPDRCRSRRR